MTPSARLNGVGKGGQRRVSGGAVAALFLNHLEGESLFWLLGPGYAPRKRYLYTSLRFFLGISMLSGAVYQRRRRVYRVDYRPCGFGAKGRTPSARWSEGTGKQRSGFLRGCMTGPENGADRARRRVLRCETRRPRRGALR